MLSFVVVLGRRSPGGDLEGRIVSQLLVIVGVFVARSNAEDPAGENLRLGVGGMKGIAWIEDRLVDASNQVKSLVDFA